MPPAQLIGPSTMPRYHFGSVDGAREPDAEGVLLADDRAAKSYAVKYAGELLQSDSNMLCEHGQWRVEVTDDNGGLLCTVMTMLLDAPPLAYHHD